MLTAGFSVAPVTSKAVPSVLASSVCWSLHCLVSTLTQGGDGGHFFRLTCSVCCGEGGALQINITGMCREVAQCLSRTGFAHGVCAFMVYTSQALGCSAGNCLRRALGCMHFPGLSHSGSGSRVLHKGADSVRPAFCGLPRSEQLRWPGAWRAQSPAGGWVHLIASPIPATQFSGCTTARLLRCAVCVFWGADLWLWPSQWMSAIQNPKKSWLAMKPACSFGRGCLSGAVIAPFRLWLPSPAGLRLGMGCSTAR